MSEQSVIVWDLETVPDLAATAQLARTRDHRLSAEARGSATDARGDRLQSGSGTLGAWPRSEWVTSEKVGGKLRQVPAALTRARILHLLCEGSSVSAM